jgi:hypothetical protein
MIRGQKYENMDKIQEEIKESLSSLAPKCVSELKIQVNCGKNKSFNSEFVAFFL